MLSILYDSVPVAVYKRYKYIFLRKYTTSFTDQNYSIINFVSILRYTSEYFKRGNVVILQSLY